MFKIISILLILYIILVILCFTVLIDTTDNDCGLILRIIFIIIFSLIGPITIVYDVLVDLVKFISSKFKNKNNEQKSKVIKSIIIDLNK